MLPHPKMAAGPYGVSRNRSPHLHSPAPAALHPPSPHRLRLSRRRRFACVSNARLRSQLGHTPSAANSGTFSPPPPFSFLAPVRTAASSPPPPAPAAAPPLCCADAPAGPPAAVLLRDPTAPPPTRFAAEASTSAFAAFIASHSPRALANPITLARCAHSHRHAVHGTRFPQNGQLIIIAVAVVYRVYLRGSVP